MLRIESDDHGSKDTGFPPFPYPPWAASGGVRPKLLGGCDPTIRVMGRSREPVSLQMSEVPYHSIGGASSTLPHWAL